MLNTKKAFTFAELMISLVVIAVITLILYPTISDLSPNNNKYLFKETYQTITMLVSDYINSAGNTAVPVDSGSNLCRVFCDRLNVVTTNGNNNSCTSCTVFTTSNGMRWAFRGGADGYILVDVNASNNRLAGDITAHEKLENDPDNPGGQQINTATQQLPKGAPNIEAVWNNVTTGIFYTSDPITCDTFLFKITSSGHVSPYGAVAIKHIESED